MSTCLSVASLEKKSYKKQAFLYSLVIACIIFIPFIIAGKGIYIHYGDYNVQQIPFYQLAHKAVKSGNVFWSWYTDLGANFIGSYSFYLLFSPFFWITIPFSNAFVPYLMGPLLILKTACASFTAYLYLERFVKDKYYAVLGGMLYAFSGWMTFNIFFNHFHDVAVFFPLLLLGVEKLVTEDKKIFFALAVTVNAMVNYWFFVGEAVFVILYVIIRGYSGGWGLTWKKFFHLALEAILGFLLAAFAVLPSVLAISGNPRTGTDRILYGWGMWIYWFNTSKHGDYAQRIPAILSSIIFPPELAAIPNFFSSHGAEWSSMSAWLPMFSVSGVIAYFTQRKNKSDWVKKILALCLLFSLVPVLNSLFVMLNNSYYARWFYMPVLIMALATIVAIEQSRYDIASFKSGIKWTVIPATVIAIAVGLTPNKVDGEWVIGLAEEPFRVWIWYGVLILGLVLVAVCIVKYRYRPFFKRLLTGCLAIITAGFGLIYLTTAKLEYPRNDEVLNKGLGGRKNISVPEEPFARSDIYDDTDNLLMYWERPSIQAFHSIVPPSVMEFYPEVGVERSVGSRPDPEYYAIRSLLSVKWLFINVDKDDQEPMPGYTYYDTQHFYNIYQNENYIPMGFTYDYALTQENIDDLTYQEAGNIMLRAMILDEEDIEKNSDIISELPQNMRHNLDIISFTEDCQNRNEKTAQNFEINKRGFTATTDFDDSELVFFSVPFENGWSAYVNGEKAEIIHSNIGFMAVRVPIGQTKIEFKYTAPGLIPGIIISASAVLIIMIWYYTIRKKQKNSPNISEEDIQAKLLEGEIVNLSWDEYLSEFDRDSRKQKLKAALEEDINENIIREFEDTDICENTQTDEENKLD